MSSEPITLFSHNVLPDEIHEAIAARYPNIEVTDDETGWREITVRFGDGTGAKSLTLLRDPDYYAGADWPRQVSGMQGYVSRFPADPDVMRQALETIAAFRFVLATRFDPDYDDPAGDERFAVILGVTALLDGVIFTPSALRDASGRVLIAADGERDPEAEWPAGAAAPAADEDEDDEDETPPPTAARVARRAVVLTAVSARGAIERDLRYNGDSVEEARRKLAMVIGWLDQLGLDDELEPEERRVLEAQPGELELQDAIDALWRVEGLAVLAWALRLFELPRYDEVADIDALWPAVGFLDAGRARALLDRPELRPADELGHFGDQMLGYHWRVRDYRLRPQPMDYRAFAANCWFGSFDLSPFELIDGDLAIAGERIDRCDRQALSTASSIAQERHRAINWLRGGDEVYSETDTST